MKLSNYLRLFVVLVCLIFFLNQTSFSQEISKSYSEHLKEVVIKAGQAHGGYPLPSNSVRLENQSDSHGYKELGEKEAVSFLLDIIKNGPDWQMEEFGSRSKIVPHIARCYAVLCLAFTKDSQAYPVLVDLLQNGTYLGDITLDEKSKQKYDIKRYAVVGLGILADERAFGLLVSSLNNPDQFIRQQSMYSLALLKDMRAIEPLIDAAEKDQSLDIPLSSCMTQMTKIRLISKSNRDEKTMTFPNFPELGAVKLGDYKLTEFWRYWYNVGKNSTKQKFEEQYNQYSQAKRTRPDEKSVISYTRRKISELGVVALPLIIEKIDNGETDLIPLVSQLTDNRVKSDAQAQEVLDWWKDNKDRWTIFK